ncbi:MAG TPA: serine/threonine-protein kinase [Anaerolineaceae bacterium]|nr:serine/threonine-protein kinase [Anaerolineaceae bacterium]
MPLPLKTGDVLRGRYRVQKIIGQGGSGSIYLADDLRLSGRQCALKEVEHNVSLPEDLIKEAREQFLREATVLARLDHPNLPKVSDFFSTGIRDYLVMDYVPGDDLRTIMLNAKQKNKFIQEIDVLSWISQLSDALIFLHEQEMPILHRDIKPSNLKLTPSGLLKLVDFGLVKVAAPGEVTITIVQGQGTALYTPLEQYGGDQGHTDVRSDIFSMGATMYHLLTNTAPTDARQRFLQPESLKPPRAINPDLSARTEKCILWAMNLHPDERPETVQELKQALFGDRPVQPRPLNKKITIQEILRMNPEQTLLLSALFFLILSFLLTVGN